MTLPNTITIVGVDPGFANIGLSAIKLFSTGGESLEETSLILTDNATFATEKTSKKKARAKSKIRRSSKTKAKLDTELNRLIYIENNILYFFRKHSPAAIVIEEPGKCLMRRYNKFTRRTEWATNPTALRVTSIMWGALHGAASALNIPCVSIGARDVKKYVTGNNKASKEQVFSAVKLKFPSYKLWPDNDKFEHVADATAIALAGIHSDHLAGSIRYFRKTKQSEAFRLIVENFLKVFNYDISSKLLGLSHKDIMCALRLYGIDLTEDNADRICKFISERNTTATADIAELILSSETSVSASARKLGIRANVLDRIITAISRFKSTSL